MTSCDEPVRIYGTEECLGLIQCVALQQERRLLVYIPSDYDKQITTLHKSYNGVE